ncbi:hypothetical protein MBLNU459_g0274t2 [Dothideomycetes sp. NU459]
MSGPFLPHQPVLTTKVKGCVNVERIVSIKATDFSGPEHIQPHAFKAFGEVKLVVHAYELYPSADQSPTDRRVLHNTSNEGPGRLTILPNVALARTWDSWTTSFSARRQLTTGAVVLMRQPAVDLNALNFNRLVLFHGPPGCGKTTLCRAIAQKLAIRLDHHFATGRLFEINTQALSSKFYSESGRLVAQMFDRVLALAKDERQLICVLIDEVESIAGSREQLSDSGECYDSIRATNQLLTALDRIRTQTNVIVLCTSNLHQSIDPAFLDRVDYEIRIPRPCKSAVYEILRSTINELIRARLISVQPYTYDDELPNGVRDMSYLPAFDVLPLLYEYPDSPPRILARIAEDCVSFSGRKLRKLPLLAITTYTWGEACLLQDALVALQTAVEQEADQDAARADTEGRVRG